MTPGALSQAGPSRSKSYSFSGSLPGMAGHHPSSRPYFHEDQRLTLKPQRLTFHATGPLLPEDLNAGDEFRLLFLTPSGHQPYSADINYYNNIVQAHAADAQAHDDIRAYSSWFKVLGSTPDVDARDNTENDRHRCSHLLARRQQGRRRLRRPL